jgi:hypothetical protein
MQYAEAGHQLPQHRAPLREPVPASLLPGATSTCCHSEPGARFLASLCVLGWAEPLLVGLHARGARRLARSVWRSARGLRRARPACPRGCASLYARRLGPCCVVRPCVHASACRQSLCSVPRARHSLPFVRERSAERAGAAARGRVSAALGRGPQGAQLTRAHPRAR